MIALLVGFALLAERAAEGSASARWLVMLILRKAENLAAGFAVEATGILIVPGEGSAVAGVAPCHARALALRFRLLAAALCALLPAPLRRDRPPAQRNLMRSRRAGGVAACGSTCRPNDTS